MRLIMAHLPTNAFERARTQLADLGVLRLTVSEVRGTSALPAVTLRYRGASLKTHLRAELRVECVAAERQARAAVNVLRACAGRFGQVLVLDIEELHQSPLQEPTLASDPRLEPAVQ